MYDSILVPTDGSDHAVRAAEHGLWLSRAFDATVHVVNVVDVADAAGPFDAGGLDSAFLERLEESGREKARSTVDASGDHGAADVRTAVVRGRPAEAILEYADDHDVDLVSMGTRGQSGLRRFVTGSVARRVLRRAPVPVLTVRDTDQSQIGDGYDEVLIPTDGSDHATLAAEHGVAIAAASNARVHVIHVVDVGAASATPSITPPTTLLDDLRSAGERAVGPVADAARDAGLDVTTTVREGFPARDILSYVREHDVDLVAMGTAGRTGLDRFVLGSTTERVVARAPVPVLSVTAGDL